MSNKIQSQHLARKVVLWRSAIVDVDASDHAQPRESETVYASSIDCTIWLGENERLSLIRTWQILASA